jgi:prolipoprotein diacylglyceryl transferase
VDPVLFHIGSFGLRWYSLGFLFAFLFGYYIMYRFFKQEKVDSKYLDSLVVYIFLAVLIGARLGHCLFYEPDYFLTHDHWMEIILPMRQVQGHWIFTGYEGLASHGAAIGILIALWLFYRKYHMNPLWVVERLAIVVALGGSFIRLGNLMNSEIYGVQTDLPWGFIFERNGETVPKHPTQLYEAFSYLLIFIVCLIIYIRKKGNLHCGRLFGWWLVALFGARFLIEFVKEKQVNFENGMSLDMGQWLSIPFILAGLILVILSHKKKLPEDIFIQKEKKQ